MTKKIFSLLAGLIIIAMCAIGCDAVTDDNDAANPFKGKTFKEGEHTKYVFSSDGKTVTCEHDNDDGEGFVPYTQYEYSVDTKKQELIWHLKKIIYDSEQLYSFEELVAYIKSEEFLKKYEARLQEKLDKEEITKAEFDEQLKEMKESINDENSFYFFNRMFTGITRFKYTYDSGTLDLVEQFEESSASFEYREDSQSPSNGLSFDSAYVSNYAYINFRKDNERITFFAQSFFDNKIVFVHENDKSITFTASYTLTGSDNETQMLLSFEYDGKKFDQPLNFAQSKINLTEVK